MIDRKALWFSITVIVAMVAAAIWRLSLLPDWHQMSLDGPGTGTHTMPSIFLFVQPLGLTVATASLYSRKWFLTGNEDAIRPWRHWGTLFVVAFCTVVGLMQAFMISRSLGYGLAIDRPLVARISFAAMGALLMMAGNMMPKLPWLAGRFRSFHLDPWQQNRHLRFTGKMMFGMGTFFVALALALPWLNLLPQALRIPVVLAPAPLMVAASLWHRARLKREPSPQ